MTATTHPLSFFCFIMAASFVRAERAHEPTSVFDELVGPEHVFVEIDVDLFADRLVHPLNLLQTLLREHAGTASPAADARTKS